ncbi:dead (asp-glu-ala-asp) box [Lynx pardinus]|uniref:ATP-dependent RNA helicase n=1 Tax=Lynx pardinus TaxID=191816 RepID=A0A485NS54_LYNPA|nr:dead (asp-glu-ala-asp) box [Lynx pardinus]
MQKKLRAHGISSYFPVQAAVIPALLESTANGFLVARGGYRPSDLCVSAPTGSGKTLAFVIPVVQALLCRAVCQVRALVVLPTKELAQQVSKVFNVYTDATPLRVALITGQKSLVKEQETLVQRTADGFRCLADVVVATPGRLVDHIDQTPGFSLRHLRFLVIDEADRMIDSMHQSWLPRVVEAAFPSDSAKEPCALLQRRRLRATTAASTCCPQMPLQKLLFSATLTQNPEKLQQLGLHQPRLFSTGLARGGPKDVDGDSGGKYTFPAGLSHCYVPCSLRTKPLVILHLILERNFSRVLCFTNSRENSHRLFLLVQAFGGVTAAEFSSRCGPGQRKVVLKQFEQGRIRLAGGRGAPGLGRGLSPSRFPASSAQTPRLEASTCRVCSWSSTTTPPSTCGPTCTGSGEPPAREEPDRPSRCCSRCRRGGSSGCWPRRGHRSWHGTTSPASS